MRELVTFYRSYGFRDGDGWRIPLRAWVHERLVLSALTDRLSAALGISDGGQVATFRQRFRDFVADSESREDVTLRFDGDDVDRRIAGAGGRTSRTDLNGLVAGTLTLTGAEARTLLERQRSTHGWLAFRASSAGHHGHGHVQLIPPTGVSVVSDIDDTIKETHIPAGKREVLRNTFFRPFAAAAGMAGMYRGFADAAFHYVSGGPFQLYEPLAEFLFGADAGFPAGSFHMKVIPRHLLSLSTWDSIERLLINPEATVDHKVSEISTVMRHFPGRQFVLIGDSGERDPEVYRTIHQTFGPQVREIRIRDVIGARSADPARLTGMTVIEAPTIERRH